MGKLTKDEVILQLANLASGIERTTGDSLKAKALREAIAMLDTAPKTDAEKRYNIHGCGSANEVIKKLSLRNSDLEDALSHIFKVAASSRSQSRRDRWISIRAKCAVDGSRRWEVEDLPKVVDSPRNRELKLKAERDNYKAKSEELEKQLADASWSG